MGHRTLDGGSYVLIVSIIQHNEYAEAAVAQFIGHLCRSAPTANRSLRRSRLLTRAVVSVVVPLCAMAASSTYVSTCVICGQPMHPPGKGGDSDSANTMYDRLLGHAS